MIILSSVPYYLICPLFLYKMSIVDFEDFSYLDNLDTVDFPYLDTPENIVPPISYYVSFYNSSTSEDPLSEVINLMMSDGMTVYYLIMFLSAIHEIPSNHIRIVVGGKAIVENTFQLLRVHVDRVATSNSMDLHVVLNYEKPFYVST